MSDSEETPLLLATPLVGVRASDDDYDLMASAMESGRPVALKAIRASTRVREDDRSLEDLSTVSIFFRHGIVDVGHAQPWFLLGVTILVMWWLPILLKLLVSGSLGCGAQGCFINYMTHLPHHFGHFSQGVLAGALLSPWPCISLGGGRGPRRQEKLLMWKAVAMGLLMSAYPVYNVVKRSYMSTPEQRRRTGYPRFFDSSYFFNNLDLTIGFSIAFFASVILLGTIFGARQTEGSLRPHFQSHKWFSVTAVLVVMVNCLCILTASVMCYVS